MNNCYAKAGWALGLLGLTGAPLAQGQNLNYSLGSASITTDTFNGLSIADSTPIVVQDADDDNSSAQNLGFTFQYNGQSFSQFVINTNGVLKLGDTPLSATFGYFETTNDPADANLLFPLHNDLVGASSSTSFRYATTGTAPSRVCTVQWTDMSEFGSTPQFTDFTFQVKLYETTNVIEFVYGPSVPGAAVRPSAAAVGLKGSRATTNQVLLAYKDTSNPFAAAGFQSTTYVLGQAFNYDQSSLPVVGQVFRFTPNTTTAAQDAQLVRAVSVYPNPSNGQVTLEVRGANAQHGLRVEVSNLLGQRVYTGTAKDNFNNSLNLAHLPKGLYTVKVSNDSRHAVSRLLLR